MTDQSNLNFLLGPTNTGKTYYAINRMLAYSSGIIGLPLRLLAREIYDQLAIKKGKLSIALVTGEEQIIPPRAKYFICTVESMPTDKIVEFIAVDEIQLCNDYERGHVFTDRLFHSRGSLETLFLGSDTMEKIIKIFFPKSSIIKKSRRSKLTYVGKNSLNSLPTRSAIIAFRISDVYDIASKLKSSKGGAAVVSGALSPQTRNSQVAIFEEGSVDYIVATDAIGMGLNLNINNVSFSSIKKYDGKELRTLTNTEIAQIAGRAGRNHKDGFFSSTLSAPLFSSKVAEAVEKNQFDQVNFLYWRNKNLNFSSINSLFFSLATQSPHSLLIKTLNTREENILKYLVTVSDLKKYLENYDNIKLLWEISTIPDYIKTLDYNYTDLLIKLYINIAKQGYINTEWALKEVMNLKNKEGSIEVITFSLAKIRFWNYIANKKHWFKNNIDLKVLAQETEHYLSKGLHDKLTAQFVDSKLHLVAKEIKLDKSLNIKIYENKEIFLNHIKVGLIKGLEVYIFERKSLIKNKTIYNKFKNKVSNIINDYILSVLKKENFNITFNNDLHIIYENNKIGSMYKGKDIFSPGILISKNDFIDKKIYIELEKKIKTKLGEIINKAFWKHDEKKYTKSKNIKAILFSLNENLGIINKDKVLSFYNNLSKDDLQLLKKENVFIDKNHLYFKKITDNKGRSIRWLISCLFFYSKSIPKAPQKRVFKNILNYNSYTLNSIGYIKLKKFAVKLSYLEYIFRKYLFKNKSVYIFNFSHKIPHQMPKEAFHEILNYFNLKRIAGTDHITYWKKSFKKVISRNYYDKDNPFYILNKLQ